jgi:hypothetical protein
MHYMATASILVLGLWLISCAKAIPDSAKQELQRPVSCETARHDIEILEVEKATVATQIAAGVGTVVPTNAVLSILRRDTKDRLKVAAGTYNREIEDKIKEIKRECGISQ